MDPARAVLAAMAEILREQIDDGELPPRSEYRWNPETQEFELAPKVLIN